MRRLSVVLVPALLAGILMAAPAEAAPTCFGRPATIVGTSGSDVLRGTPGPDVIVGNSGRDVIIGRGGDDRLCAADGHADGEDEIRGGPGADRLSGGRAYNRLVGGSGPDVLRVSVGSSQSNELIGGRGDDDIKGSGADDDIYPGPGDDVVDGMDGYADEGIVLSDELFFRAATRAVRVDLEAGTARGQGRDRIRNVASIIGTRFDDHMRSGAYGNALVGGRGDDVLLGYETAAEGATGDVLIGGKGDDELVGSVDPGDHLEPGAGTDTIDGGGGGGRLSYRRLSTPVHVDMAAGVATAGDDIDTFTNVGSVYGTASADTILGTEGSDYVWAGAGADFVDAEGAADYIYGAEGNDTLIGGDGDDVIWGYRDDWRHIVVDLSEGDDDEIDAGAGDDRVDGGPGDDSCSNAERTSNCES